MNTTKPATPPTSWWHNPEGYISENVIAAGKEAKRSVRDVIAYTELQPEKALLWAVGAGYLLRMLPTVGILSAIVRVLMGLLKPALVLYGGVKCWQTLQPFVAPRASVKSETPE